MAKPKVEIFSREELEEIHIRSLSVLRRVGVRIEHEKALKVLHEIGAEVDPGKKIAKIPEHIVKEAIKRAPHSIKLYYRDGKRYLDLYGWNTYFVVGSAGLYYIDWRTNESRRALTKDLIEVARITDYLPNTHIASTALVPHDVPDVIADRWRMYVVIKNTVKPMDTGGFTPEAIPDAVKLMASVIGEENVSRKPFMSFAICPSPPLKWTKLAVQNLIDCAKYSVPAHIIPMPQTGGTAPATLAGAITQANAEFLSGLVIAQFTNPGAPVIYHGSPTVFDIRYGTSCTGFIEVGLLSLGMCQLAKYYGLPFGSYTLVSDAKVVDAQAALETAFGALISVLGGINMATGSGMLYEENAISLIKLVIDDDICGSALRFSRGVTVDIETIAEKLIEEVGPGGLFIRHKATRDIWLKEHFMPKLLDKKTVDMWKKTGGKDINTVAKEYVEKILKEHVPELLPPDIEKDLSRAMYEIAKRYGIESFPEV
ncbi:MAG: trimethylamine methyltransferase family protein [Thermosphaera sp.]